MRSAAANSAVQESGNPARNPASATAVAASAFARRRRSIAGDGRAARDTGSPRRSRRKRRWSTTATAARAASAGTRSAAVKRAYGIPDSVPTIMFCGFPVSVAALPAFEPKASARR